MAEHVYVEPPRGELVELTREEAELLRDGLDAVDRTRGLSEIVHGLAARTEAEEPHTDAERRKLALRLPPDRDLTTEIIRVLIGLNAGTPREGLSALTHSLQDYINPPG